MWFEIVFITIFAIGLGVVVWWTWTQKQLALRQSRINAELAELGRGIRAVAHDLSHQFEVMTRELDRVRHQRDDDLRDRLDGVSQAARGAAQIVEKLRGGNLTAPRAGPASIEGVVRLSVIMLRSTGVPIDLRVRGRLEFQGDESDAMRVVQNLLSNAVREAGRHEGGRVTIELEDRALAVTNPVLADAILDDTIYLENVSYSGSTGLGLKSAADAAGRAGLRVRHEHLGERVTFFVEPVIGTSPQG